MGPKRSDRREFLKSGAAFAGGLTSGAAQPALGQTLGPGVKQRGASRGNPQALAS